MIPGDQGRTVEEILEAVGTRRPAVFLDYDGTLTPLVSDPAAATLPDRTRLAVARLARRCPVAIVSGRDLRDVRRLAGLDGLVYAGSHGFEIEGGGDLRLAHPGGLAALPALAAAEERLRDATRGLPGAAVERKRFAIAVHSRRLARELLPELERRVREVAAEHRELRLTGGKEILELRPDVDWDKGRAVLWLLESLGLDRPEVIALYVGDDETDEDAFRALGERGLGVRVGAGPTAAAFVLPDHVHVCTLLERLESRLAAATGR